MMALVQQTLSAIPAVQAFTREEFEHERFRRYATRPSPPTGAARSRT